MTLICLSKSQDERKYPCAIPSNVLLENKSGFRLFMTHDEITLVRNSAYTKFVCRGLLVSTAARSVTNGLAQDKIERGTQTYDGPTSQRC